MALIQCPECGHDISDRAEKCIHCGYPLNEIFSSETHKWRCANCGELTSSSLCHKCGKSSTDKKFEVTIPSLDIDTECELPIITHKWQCSKCGNMISEEPCPYCNKVQSAVNINTVYYENSAEATTAFVAKNKRNLRVLSTILVVVVVAIFIGIQLTSIERDKDSLVGEWMLVNNCSLTFFENGTALWEAPEGTITFNWDTNGNIMTWYMSGVPYSYNFVISNDTLYVDGEYYATRQ